jgi:dihydroorotase
MKYLIKNAKVINEGRIFEADVLVEDKRISKIDTNCNVSDSAATVIDASGKYLIPGVIDDQVHFREPGLTYKADINSESRAAVAGGVTSFMEMPNTVPNTFTQVLLESKYEVAAQKSLANYSFYMGASNDNIEEVLKTDPSKVCGVKVFMGSSTGNMLVDNEKTLEGIFSQSPMLIATHCEDETTIRLNTERYKIEYGDKASAALHPLIRSAEACYVSSSMAVGLAKKFNSRLHVLHISTAKELELFDANTPLKDKRITAEACVHHLWFDESDYPRLGNCIKWNPAIKTREDREAVLKGLLENKIDVIATDHAPHTIEEKEKPYFEAPSGGPLIQHSLVAMLELHKKGKISLEKIVEKMTHAPAECFQVKDRGFIREGYFADLAIIDLNSPWTVSKLNILAKCGWSPFDGELFHSSVTHTFVNGNLVYQEGKVNDSIRGERLQFNR